MQWICTICKYVHEGDEPPDICPVCKKGKEFFEPVEEEPEPVAEVTADRWRCVVCNYVHDGPEPPDVCPVCGKDREFFQPETESPDHRHEGFSGLVERLHLHPVCAHMPNGALPLALLAWLAWLITGEACLERTSFYLAVVAVVVAPVTFYSGWSDAKHRFGSTTTGIFPEKKLWSWVLMVVAAVTLGWRLWIGWDAPPEGGLEVAVFTVLLLAGNALTARLGLLGGKLVFGH